MTTLARKVVFVALKLALVVLFVLPAVGSPLPQLHGRFHHAPVPKPQRIVLTFR